MQIDMPGSTLDTFTQFCGISGPFEAFLAISWPSCLCSYFKAPLINVDKFTLTMEAEK